MNRLKLYAAMAMTAFAVAGTAVPAQAAGSKVIETQLNGRNCYVKVIVSPIGCLPGNSQPVIPCLPSLPGQPGGSEETETPEQPELPDTPDTPNQPELPDTPDTPSQPEIPSQPDTPGTPDSSETPDEDNSYAAQVVRLVNEERAKVGLSALTIDEGLTAAANVRANEIVTSFSHTRPDGSSFSSAIRDAGVSFKGAGENIAWGQKSPEAVVDAWMNSPGHRANILNEKFTRIGVGHYQNSSGTNYWAQLFAY